MFCTLPASLPFLVDVMSYCLDLGPHGTPPHIQTAYARAVGPSVLSLGSWAPIHWHPPADAADLSIWMEATLVGVTMNICFMSNFMWNDIATRFLQQLQVFKYETTSDEYCVGHMSNYWNWGLGSMVSEELVVVFHHVKPCRVKLQHRRTWLF